MVLDVAKKDCCGCAACMNACPKACITMEEDGEFFKYPHVDEAKCVGCRLCEKACPVLSNSKPKNEFVQAVYAAWNKDQDKRINSTSGGIVSAFSERVISEGGCVVGAYYKEDFTVAHMIGYDEKDILLLRQSKYMQSDMGLIYQNVKNVLKQGNKVLFCGTPCHNAALRAYLGQDYDGLVQLDFICRGVISPGVFVEYLKYLENKYKSKAVTVQFKNKDFGWNRFSTKIWFANGKTYIKDRYHDPYMVSYLRYSVSLRPSCYNCHFKGTERYSDITVGDFWGIGKVNASLDENKGTSLVIVNSQKGNELFEAIGDRIEKTKCSMDDIPEGNLCLSKSPKMGEDRELFFKDLGRKSFGFVYFRYLFQRKLKMGLKRFKNSFAKRTNN